MKGSRIEKFDLETGSLASDRHIPVNLTFDASRAAAGEQLSLNAKFDLSQDAAQKPLRFSAVNMSGTLARPGDRRPAHWELTAPEIDMQCDGADARCRGVHLELFRRALHRQRAGQQNLRRSAASSARRPWRLWCCARSNRGWDLLCPRRVTRRRYRSFPRQPISPTTQRLWTLTHLQLRLDDTQVQGNLKLLAGDTAGSAIRSGRRSDRSGSLSRAARRQRPRRHLQRPRPRPKPEKPWEANGTLTIKSAKLARLDLSNVRVTVAAKDKVMHLSPIDAQVDGGRLAGDVTWDSQGAIPALSVDEQLTGIDMARLLANTAGKGRLSGRATLNLKATGAGCRR